jgi:hypothetical protein
MGNTRRRKEGRRKKDERLEERDCGDCFNVKELEEGRGI